MNIEPIVLIESGKLFEGTCNQFEDCFFSFPDDLSIEDKLTAIEDWCMKEKYSFSWSYELTPYQKADDSTWLGDKMISTESRKD